MTLFLPRDAVSAMPLNEEEFCDLVRNWTRRLVLFAHQWTDSAEDAVQEAFANLSQLPVRPDDAVSWLFKATRHAAMNLRRSETARIRREQRVAQTKPEWFVPTEDCRLDAELVTEKLQELPPELHEVIVARLWGELTFEQIAVATDSSVATAYRRYNEALAVLRKRLKNEE